MNNRNYVELVGIINQPEYSHENHGERFYSADIVIERLSGYRDYVPLIVSEHLLPLIGGTVLVTGQFRSCNITTNGKKSLKLGVLVDSIEGTNRPDMNKIVASGYVCKDPVNRKTLKGMNITDMLLSIPRKGNGKLDYIPCIIWERNALFAAKLPRETVVEIEGRIQSREYKKGKFVKMAYEVSIDRISVESEACG